MQKLSEVRSILGSVVNLQSRAVDVDEIQGSIEQIAEDKARRAADVVGLTSGLDLLQWSAEVLGFGD